jgi:hypothetical protein
MKIIRTQNSKTLDQQKFVYISETLHDFSIYVTMSDVINRSLYVVNDIVLFKQKIQQDTTVYQNLLFHIYIKLNMFRATHRPSSGA